MSGVEAVAGLILGGLPLLLAAAEHYKSIYRPFQRWRKFHEELKRLDAELLVEKVTFHNECLILLGSLVGGSVAKEMLDCHEHPLWHDKNLDENLSTHLGSSKEAWGMLLELVDLQLRVMDVRIRGFSAEVTKYKEVSSSEPYSLLR